MTSPLERFLQMCSPREDGFASLTTSDAWRLGAVLYAQRDDQFVAVQKAQKPGYKFSDAWALPGGMVRATEGSFRRQVDSALIARVRAEAGVEPETVHPLAGLGPIVTAYAVKGVQRFTLIAGFACQVANDAEPSVADSSIQAVRWTDADVNLAAFAPANRLLIAHLLWPNLDADRQEHARSVIAEAAEACSGFASVAGVTPAPTPWASDVAIADWATAWPGQA